MSEEGALDREDQNSAQESLCNLFSGGMDQMTSFFQNRDFERRYEAHSSCYPFPEFVRREAVSTFGPFKELGTIYWFHLARVFPQSNFSKGILPLNKSIHLIWEGLLHIFKTTKHYANLFAMCITMSKKRNFPATSICASTVREGPSLHLILRKLSIYGILLFVVI